MSLAYFKIDSFIPNSANLTNLLGNLFECHFFGRKAIYSTFVGKKAAKLASDISGVPQKAWPVSQ